jgi:hypothetical protein
MTIVSTFIDFESATATPTPGGAGRECEGCDPDGYPYLQTDQPRAA